MWKVIIRDTPALQADIVGRSMRAALPSGGLDPTQRYALERYGAHRDTMSVDELRVAVQGVR